MGTIALLSAEVAISKIIRQSVHFCVFMKGNKTKVFQSDQTQIILELLESHSFSRINLESSPVLRLVYASLRIKLFKVGITASSFPCQMTDEADGLCFSCHQSTHEELASS